MIASDIMTKTVATIRNDATLLDAITAMVDRRVSGLPVTDAAGKLVGIVTEGDLLRRAETNTGRRRPAWLDFLRGPNRAAADYVRTHSRVIDDLMTTDVATITEDTDLDEVVNLMEKKGIKRVPVMRGEALMGIVSRADILRALAAAINKEPGAALTDEQIAARIDEEIKHGQWGGGESVTISVHDGVVKLEGVIFNDGLRPALRVAAQNIPGVKAVEDHLVWVEPVTGMSLGAH